MNFTKLFVASIAIVFSVTVHAEESRAAAAAAKPDLLSTFLCEKFSGSLSELKLKLVETCNIEKPFSSSMTRTVAGDEIYVVCCHKAK